MDAASVRQWPGWHHYSCDMRKGRGWADIAVGGCFGPNAWMDTLPVSDSPAGDSNFVSRSVQAVPRVPCLEGADGVAEVLP